MTGRGAGTSKRTAPNCAIRSAPSIPMACRKAARSNSCGARTASSNAQPPPSLTKSAPRKPTLFSPRRANIRATKHAGSRSTLHASLSLLSLIRSSNASLWTIPARPSSNRRRRPTRRSSVSSESWRRSALRSARSGSAGPSSGKARSGL